MARQKLIGWKLVGAAAVLTLLFLIGGLLTFTPKAAAAPTYSWTDPSTIVATDGGTTTTFNCSSTGGTSYTCKSDTSTTDGHCQIPEILISGKATSGQLDDYTYSAAAGCVPFHTSISIAGLPYAPTNIGGGGQSGGGTSNTSGSSSDSGQADPNLNCGTLWNPLNWFICPLVHGMNFIVNQLDTLINDLLEVDQKKIFDTSTASGWGYHNAWQDFRGFALAILVAAGLIMVIAQALGFEVLDAYTIKKMLPRLILAIIGISLSWYIMEFLVVLTNDLGDGLRHLIYAPFTNPQKFPVSLKMGVGAQFITWILALGAIPGFGLMGLLSFIATAALAVFVAFIVLMIRQLVVVLLVLFAPLAIACFVLPNTQNAYKLWSESFVKALMMFPIIVAFLSIGRVFAIVAIGGNVTNVPAISQIMGFAAYILPYFLIPFTFRFAGGAMRTLGGAINDRNRGAFDRLKKYRGNKVATNMHAMKEGTRYRPSNRLARGFNAVTHNTAMAPEAGINPWTMRSRFRSAKAEHSMAAMEEVRKSSAFITGSQDDRILRAAQHGQGRAGIRAWLENEEGVTDAHDLDDLTGVAERMQASGGREAVEAAIVMQRFATGTGFTKTDKKTGQQYIDYDDMFSSIRNASGGDRGLAGTLLGQAKSIANQAGQTSFGGAAYGTLSAELSKKFNYNPQDPRSHVDGQKVALDAFDSTDDVTKARARTIHLQYMTDAAVQRTNDIHNNTAENVKPGELGQRVAGLETFRQTVSMYGAPDRQQVVNATVPLAEPAIRTVHSQVEAAQKLEQAATRLATVGKNWTPSQPMPQTAAPAPGLPKTPPNPDVVQYHRFAGRGAAAGMTDPRLLEQLRQEQQNQDQDRR